MKEHQTRFYRSVNSQSRIWYDKPDTDTAEIVVCQRAEGRQSTNSAGGKPAVTPRLWCRTLGNNGSPFPRLQSPPAQPYQAPHPATATHIHCTHTGTL